VSRTTCLDPMSTPFLIILLALLAIAIAVIPLLVGSFKDDRSVDDGGSNTIHLGALESNRRHARLGRRTRRSPHELAPDSESTVAFGQRR